MRIFSHKNRPVHLGPYPLERLARTAGPMEHPARASRGLVYSDPSRPHSIVNAMEEYANIMDRMREGPVAPRQAPIPEDLRERAEHIKAACYYLDASMTATCRLPREAILENPIENASLHDAMERQYGVGSAANAMSEISVREGRAAWERARELLAKPLDHGHALVILVAHTRDPDERDQGSDWIEGSQAHRAALRAAEVGAVMANYLRLLGFEARLHTASAAEVDFDGLLLASGLGEVTGGNGDSRVEAPFLGARFGMAVVTTAMALAADAPLAPGASARGRDFKWWLGVGGTHAGYQGEAMKNRPFHLGPHPMEKIKRRDTPTTLVDAPNVPRVPKRNDFFLRAAMGDLGDKAAKELHDFRMITKSPFGHAMIPVLGGMVPLQYGDTAGDRSEDLSDPALNAARIKSALYYLGADMVGICEVPEYAWYSHDLDGSEIRPYHRYAICVLVDQGYETMEGASGDDWISGAQSMRAYMRAQLIGGVVGAQIRRLGHSARGHSVLDQDVLHIPLILQAGLGELSRIGELVLNPFVGPRFKSGIITTDLPLATDRPIDFGLQDFCGKCRKCARECPCTAIPFGDKIVFNGYEMWKPDVEKCARYRITNAAGSMCGRCMKTCPWNIEGVLKERPFLWSAIHLPGTRRWLAALDDRVGNGRINPVKKWWWDLDTDDEGNVIPAKRTNARELEFRSASPGGQKLACYPVEVCSPPVSEKPLAPNRKAGMEYYRSAPTPEVYRARMERGEDRSPGTPAWRSTSPEGDDTVP